MKTITETHLTNTRIIEKPDSDFAVDTTFVLFFLAVELGRSFNIASFDTVFLTLTLVILAIVPFFLSNLDRSEFRNWVIGRFAIASFAFLLGWAFKQSLGVVIPDMFRFMPMTLLIVTAMLCCYIQFYGFLKLRLAR